MQTLNPEIFAAQLGKLGDLERVLRDAPVGSPEHETARVAYRTAAESLMDYVRTHRPFLQVTVTADKPSPYVNQVAVTSSGFENLPNGSRMLANVIALLHLTQPRDEYDETHADIAVRNGDLAHSVRDMVPIHSPYHGGAHTTHFVPSKLNGTLLAVQDAQTMVTDQIAAINAVSLGRRLNCRVGYGGYNLSLLISPNLF